MALCQLCESVPLLKVGLPKNVTRMGRFCKNEPYIDDGEFVVLVLYMEVTLTQYNIFSLASKT